MKVISTIMSDRIYGFRNGYHGMVKGNEPAPILLDTEMVNAIHQQGGTILGSSRGPAGYRPHG